MKRVLCARWCSTPPGSRSARPICPTPSPGRDRCSSRSPACGVCRTDLHVVDGELPDPKLPLVLGHQIVGTVARGGERFAPGERVGVPWLGWTCGECRYCRSGRENLCDRARFTGYDLDGGYAELAVADERFCFPIPDGYPRRAGRAAPLRRPDRLPRAAHGRRRRAARPLRLRRRGPHRRQVARHEGRRVFAFTRGGDDAAQSLARVTRRRVGGRLGRRRPGGARRGDPLRAGRASSCRRRCARARRVASSSAPAST